MGHYFTEANVTLWTEFSCSFFLTLFLGIFCWAYSPRRAEQFGKESKLPLEE